MNFLETKAFTSEFDYDRQKGNRNNQPEPDCCSWLQKHKHLFRPDVRDTPYQHG